MAGGKLDFWSGIKNAMVAFLILVFVIIMAALLVNSLIHGKPNVAVENIVKNTAQIGRIYQRPE